MEKVAWIVNKSMKEEDIRNIYLVGGTCLFYGFADLMKKETGIDTSIPKNPLFTTPLGIALACRNLMVSQLEREA